MENPPQAEDAAAIAAEAMAPIGFGEGPTVGIVGDSRCGKTEAARRLIAEYMRRSPGPVLIADDKEATPQFEGQCRRDKDDVEKNPPDANGSRVIILRGDRFDVGEGEVDPEEIAEMQRELAYKFHTPSLGVYDELDRACEGGQFKRNPSTIRWSFKQGKSSGVASLWGTQETQDIPAPIFNQSSMILCFRMQGAPLRLLKERGYLEPRNSVELVIPTLPGAELPPDKRGHFVALRRGQTWDGKIWRFK
ncbi:MAG TPA: ATP-binding protein [Gaiellaceae bacterium]|nr:ATP-binding protein [Gaiellaceae bacterium]